VQHASLSTRKCDRGYRDNQVDKNGLQQSNVFVLTEPPSLRSLFSAARICPLNGYHQVLKGNGRYLATQKGGQVMTMDCNGLNAVLNHIHEKKLTNVVLR
jgi:hypothetical protein